MSGNFTQRGEPTIVEISGNEPGRTGEWVDLVVELPLYFACQPAHRFAAVPWRSWTNSGADGGFGAEHPSGILRSSFAWPPILTRRPQTVQCDHTQFNDQRPTNRCYLKAPNDNLPLPTTRRFWTTITKCGSCRFSGSEATTMTGHYRADRQCECDSRSG